MKIIPVDSSSLISLSVNCMLGILDRLHEAGIQFVITPEIKKEVVDSAVNIERFRLGAVRIMKRLCNGVINVEEPDYDKTKEILNAANNILRVNGKTLSMVHEGEISLISIAQNHGSNIILTDERIMDKLLTNPDSLRQLIENRLHTNVGMNDIFVQEFNRLNKGVTTIKSSDLLAIAYEKKLLGEYTKGCLGGKIVKDFVNGALWGLKINGCSISTLDIEEYMHELF